MSPFAFLVLANDEFYVGREIIDHHEIALGACGLQESIDEP